ncbi:hypothetical protein PR002_g25039 [Phytophthora rubi]|uniref:Transmembrane protein n=1 Tax=Phytophthora rubi TaxID=129364 RepID=A0A6A3IBC1_9STRA|nr:hypothetical protein PR002_g25039 [Phytophthora rubi]
MLFLPLEEDSWLFRLCLYYGLLVLLLELLVPLVFHRRVRVEIPRLALHGPAVPLSTREFMQRRRALQQQLAALQRALAETPRRSPRKRKQLLDASAAKDRPDASPSPSRVASPTSSVKVSRLQSSRGTSNSKSQIQRRSERKDGREEQRDRDAARQRREDKVVDGEEDQVPSQRPAAMNNSSGTRPAQSGGFSFNEVAREEKKEEENQASWHEPVVWEQADEKQVDDDVTIAATHSAEKRKRHEVFGSEDENASGDAVEADQVLEKRTHAEAFGAEDKPDRPQEKTPRIARRISFSDEVAALSAASPKEVPGGRSNVKRKHQQAFGMIDEEDEDADWRESLAFRPHRSG